MSTISVKIKWAKQIQSVFTTDELFQIFITLFEKEEEVRKQLEQVQSPDNKSPNKDADIKYLKSKLDNLFSARGKIGECRLA